MTLPTKNPKGTYVIIAFSLAVGLMISLFGPSKVNRLAGLGPILAAVAGVCGLQRGISVDADFVVIRFVAGEFRYPLNDITGVRSITDSKSLMDFFRGHPRVEIITKSGKSVTLLPKEPAKLLSILKR